MSSKNDDISYLYSYCTGTQKNNFVWGLGAYLRRIFLKEDFPKNITAIIDRDRGSRGEYWNGIPIVSSDILLKEEYKKATIIITSVLYEKEIREQLKNMNFEGTIVTAFHEK